MNQTLTEQANRLRKMANSIKTRVESLDDLSSNNVILELREIADVIEKEARDS